MPTYYQHPQYKNEFNINASILFIKDWIQYLSKSWWKILLFTLLGGLVGFFYAKSKPVTYPAKLSFIVEESKSGGALTSLAGQFGLDVLSSGSAGYSLLYGENLLMFLKSSGLVQETLLTPIDSTGKRSLADEYVDVYQLREKWKEADNSILNIHFEPTTSYTHSRVKDSLLHFITRKIVASELLVERPEKKATFINVQVNMQSELLSKTFCENLVNKAIERYINSKTTRQRANVERLQRRADSIGNLLNNTTYTSAVLQEKSLDVNPAYRSSTTRSEIKVRDKAMLSTVYGDVLKNLEIVKIQLTQETPTIQIIDKIELPLLKNKVAIKKIAFISSILFFSFSILVAIIIRIYFTKSQIVTSENNG